MKNITIVMRTALLSTVLICLPLPAVADDDNPLKDASFELRLPPDEGGWRLFDGSIFSEDQARTGSQSIFNAALSRIVQYPPHLLGAVSGSYQEFPAAPGSRWRLTGYGMTPTALEGASAFGIVQVSFFDADGEDLGTLETADISTSKAKTSNDVSSRAPAGEWVFLDTGVATAPTGTATVQAFTLYVDYSGSNRFQGVYFDDLSLCALEEGEDSCN